MPVRKLRSKSALLLLIFLDLRKDEMEGFGRRPCDFHMANLGTEDSPNRQTIFHFVHICGPYFLKSLLCFLVIP